MRAVLFTALVALAVAAPPFQHRAKGMYASNVIPEGPSVVHHTEHGPVTMELAKVNLHLIATTEKILEGSVMDIQWLGQHHRYNLVFMLTDDGNVYRSADAGKTWVDQTPMVTAHQWASHPADAHHMGFFGLHVSEADPSVVLLEGSEGRHAITTDGGRSYRPISFHEVLTEFKLHPHHANHILASTLSHKCHHEDAEGSCYKNLYVSRDSGATWKRINDYVVQYDWAAELKRGAGSHLPADAIFATVVSVKMGHQNFGVWDSRVNLVLTQDMFETHETLVERGNRFLFTEKFLAVAQVAAVGHRVNLVLSANGGRSFVETGMPYAMAQHSYTILDTSEDTVFLHVNHVGEGAQWGHVYQSNSLGTNFTLSLPSNRRDENGKCDFEKLQSMEGVYIANFINNVEALEAYEARAHDADMGQEDAPEYPKVTPEVRTVITHDKGSTWTYLTPPSVNAHRQPLHCPARDECYLHLHGVTDVFGPFYSTPSAVGLLMATGCVGDRLCFREGEINTYFSRDAGHTWAEVATGSHIYEFGDHGGLIVMANDEDVTDHVLFSWNEGLTWEKHVISHSPVLVDNIMIEPTSRAMQFVVYGTRLEENGVRTGVAFHVDFSQLHEPRCHGLEIVGEPESDYEHWSPSATGNHDACLLGHTIDYVRRKQDRACVNGMEHEPKHLVKHCQCTERDYECDFGYKREREDGGPCVRVPDIFIPTSAMKPAHCPPGAFYHVSDGHRKIAGDTCVGGVQHQLTAFACHPSFMHTGHVPIVLGLALLLFVCMCSLTFCQKRGMNVGDHIPAVGGLLNTATGAVGGSVMWVWSKLPFGGSHSSSGYSRVPNSTAGGDTFEFDEGDDDIGFGDLNLMDDEQEPQLLEPSTITRAVSGSSGTLLGGGGTRPRAGKKNS